MFSPAFLKDLGERTLATFAEALAALLKGVAAYKLGDNATGASLLSDPPPRVERGASDVVVILVAVVVVIVVLALVGVL